MITTRRNLFAGLAALLTAFTGMSPGARAGYTFQTINNNNDPTFNQLLGINNSGTIAGYFGSGAAGHPNQGYTVVPPYAQANFTSENFPGAVQTQVIGINNSGQTVGFWADAVPGGNNFGWVNTNGTFTQVVDPNTPTTGTMTNQLLGINDHNLAAGFYVDAAGTAHGYVYNITTMSFTEISISNSMGVTVTGINNSGMISGFYTSSLTGNTLGFVENMNGTNLVTFEESGSTNTMFFGLNNMGQAIGTYMDASGTQHGLLFNISAMTGTTIDDPNSTTGPGNGTILNGINDKGQYVGFYTDANGNTDGVLVSSVPEPASIALLGIGLAGVLGFAHRKRTRRTTA